MWRERIGTLALALNDKFLIFIPLKDNKVLDINQGNQLN
jgi:hypothetical protein